MTKQYVDVTANKNNIYVSYYDSKNPDVKRISKVNTINNLGLYRTSNTKTEYKSFVGGNYLKKDGFNSIKQYRDYWYKNNGIQGLDIYGEFPLEKQWIAETFKEDIKMDFSMLNIGFWDIETTVTSDKPSPNTAPERITSMVVYATRSKKYYIFCDQPIKGTNFSDKEKENIKFLYYTPDFEGEFNMLKDFVYIINEVEKLDILSAYFGNLFDFPYVFNRIARLADSDEKHNHETLKDDLFDETYMSPLKLTYKSKKGKVYISGIQLLDYFEVYDKYTFGSPESWKLDFIAQKELGVGKMELEGGFMHAYNNNYEQYVYYNYIDVKRLVELDDKLMFMELHAELSYIAKQNFEDTISPVRTWESIFYGHLKNKNIITNPRRDNEKLKYIGAYTHEPVPNFYNYPMSFDLNSLYPHLIMMYYISPETLIPIEDVVKMYPNNKTLETLLEIKKVLEKVSTEVPYNKKEVARVYDAFIERLINKEFDLEFLKENNIVMSPAIEFFRKDDDAVLPYFMSHFYDMRKIIKKDKLIMENEIEILKNSKDKESELAKLQKKYVELSNLDKISDIIEKMNVLVRRGGLKEKAFKILLNSIYGALGNNYCLFYDLRLAKSITAGGRLAILSLITAIENKLRGLYKDFTGTGWTGADFFIYSDTDSVYLNTEPLIPMMVLMYKPIIIEGLRIKGEEIGVDIVGELDNSDFWQNTVEHFEKKSEIYNKYFKPHDMLDDNGFTTKCVKFELKMSERKAFQEYCDNNGLKCVHKRKGINDTVHFFFLGDSVDDFKHHITGTDVDIISAVMTYPLDDFAVKVIQEDIIDVNYEEIAEYLNALNKMVMKRETICVNGVWVSKKNYILNVIDNEGVIYAEAKTKITGIVKSNNRQLVKDKIKDFCKKLMSFADRNSKESKEIMNNYIKDFYNEFMVTNPELIAQNKKVNFISDKMDSNGNPVKGCPINSTAAIIYNRYIKDNNMNDYEAIVEKEKMNYVYLKPQNPFNSHVFGFNKKLPPAVINYVDMEKMWEVDFTSVLDIILKASNVSLNFLRESDDITDWL